MGHDGAVGLLWVRIRGWASWLHARCESRARLKRKCIEESLPLVERGRYEGWYGGDAMASNAIADERGETIGEVIRHASCRSPGGAKKIIER